MTGAERDDRDPGHGDWQPQVQVAEVKDTPAEGEGGEENKEHLEEEEMEEEEEEEEDSHVE